MLQLGQYILSINLDCIQSLFIHNLLYAVKNLSLEDV
jgi:hypothetical protein